MHMFSKNWPKLKLWDHFNKSKISWKNLTQIISNEQCQRVHSSAYFSLESVTAVGFAWVICPWLANFSASFIMASCLLVCCSMNTRINRWLNDTYLSVHRLIHRIWKKNPSEKFATSIQTNYFSNYHKIQLVYFR